MVDFCGALKIPRVVWSENDFLRTEMSAFWMENGGANEITRCEKEEILEATCYLFVDWGDFAVDANLYRIQFAIEHDDGDGRRVTFESNVAIHFQKASR